MTPAKRAFRSPESYTSERISRDAVAPFMRSRGIKVHDDLRKIVGQGQSQLVAATLVDGSSALIRVRLCWRRDGRPARKALYSAAQLRARTLGGDWTATLEHIAQRDRDEGVTHTLLLQRDGTGTTEVHAALIPSDQLPHIWQKQYEVSAQLIARGDMGRTNKNHAANGDSPTLWLQDDRKAASHAVPDALWAWPGVIDLMTLPVVAAVQTDDTFDDCPVAVDESIGSDGAVRNLVRKSTVKRDPKVRAKVRARAAGRCERQSCGLSRAFLGFLDVHHIMGAERSDRPWTCVALCPNCHRDAHFSPEAEGIKQELTDFATQFAPSTHLKIAR